MVSNRVSVRSALLGIWVCYSLFVCAQDTNTRKALAGTESIGDTLKKLNEVSHKSIRTEQTVSTNGPSYTVVVSDATPLHLLYVHGINAVGADDSRLLRKGICKVLHECNDAASRRVYAKGQFEVGTEPPALEYFGQKIWSDKNEWSAAAPFFIRHRISGDHGEPQIVLDELNWYPLVFTPKCKFLIPGDRKLTARTKKQDALCFQPIKADPTETGRFETYHWDANAALMKVDMQQQYATRLNGASLKAGVFDWGLGDAALALGPMQEVLCAAIRQLFVQTRDGVNVDELGTLRSNQEVPVYFVTHSLGSYLSLAAMATDWQGSQLQVLQGFKPNDEQKAAADYFVKNTKGFYFLANQLALLELARLTVPGLDPPQGPIPAALALANVAEKRTADGKPRPQVIAWSAADDLLSWYVPNVPGLSVVNLPARNRSFRIWTVVAGPQGVHDNYAGNSAIVKVIFGETKP
ncbi:MAG: hypothetical protein M3O31_02065 [Acidobacteriota bacterium]|nr:hypothetical protein [Acidobacteriota bacterium]